MQVVGVQLLLQPLLHNPYKYGHRGENQVAKAVPDRVPVQEEFAAKFVSGPSVFLDRLVDIGYLLIQLNQMGIFQLLSDLQADSSAFLRPS
jgi:hypothetical protein